MPSNSSHVCRIQKYMRPEKWIELADEMLDSGRHNSPVNREIIERLKQESIGEIQRYGKVNEVIPKSE